MKECYDSYQKLFNLIGIKFLNDSMEWLGNHRVPMHLVKDDSIRGYHYEELLKSENEQKYNKKLRYIHNILIVGAVGFAGYNSKFNADMGIYADIISREEEVVATAKWYNTYKEAQDFAKNNNCTLVVLTHNPICDWQESKNIDGQCVYFNGHTHNNTLYREAERNLHIFANNQIGYKKKKILFKKAYIYNRVNPFACLNEGYYEINSNDYREPLKIDSQS